MTTASRIITGIIDGLLIVGLAVEAYAVITYPGVVTVTAAVGSVVMSGAYVAFTRREVVR